MPRQEARHKSRRLESDPDVVDDRDLTLTITPENLHIRLPIIRDSISRSTSRYMTHRKDLL